MQQEKVGCLSDIRKPFSAVGGGAVSRRPGVRVAQQLLGGPRGLLLWVGRGAMAGGLSCSGSQAPGAGGGFSLESRTLVPHGGRGLEVGAKTTAKWLPSLVPHLLWLPQTRRDSWVSGRWGEENPQREEERNRKAEVGGGSPGVSARGDRTRRN